MVADDVEPFAVAHLTGRGPHRIEAVFLEPFVGVVKEVLLAPQHPGQCLPHHLGLILADTGGSHRLIERVGLASTLIDDLIELSAEGIARRSERLFGTPNATPYVKDGINNCVVGGRQGAVNPSQTGTKAAAHYQVHVSAGTTSVIRLRLSGAGLLAPRHRAWPATRT